MLHPLISLCLISFAFAELSESQKRAIQLGFQTYLAHYQSKKRAQIQLFPEEAADAVARWIQTQRAQDLGLTEEQKKDLLQDPAALKEEILRLFGDPMQESPEPEKVSLQKKQRVKPEKTLSRFEELHSDLIGNICKNLTTVSELINLKLASRNCNTQVMNAKRVIEGEGSLLTDEWFKYKSLEDFKANFKKTSSKYAIIYLETKAQLEAYLNDPEFQTLEGLEILGDMDLKRLDFFAIQNRMSHLKKLIVDTLSLITDQDSLQKEFPFLVFNNESDDEVKISESEPLDQVRARVGKKTEVTIESKDPDYLDHILQLIEETPSIRTLKIGLTPTTSVPFLKHLKKLNQLEFLDIQLPSEEKVSVDLIRGLEPLHRLRSLKLHKIPNHPDAIFEIGNTLSHLKRLKELTAQFEPLAKGQKNEEQWKTWLKAFPALSRLKQIKIFGISRESAILFHLDQFPKKLKSFSYNITDGAPISVSQALQMWKKRRKAGFSEIEIFEFNLKSNAGVKGYISLSEEELGIVDYPVTQKDLAEIATISTSIYWINLLSNRFSKQEMLSLSLLLRNLPELEGIGLTLDQNWDPLVYRSIAKGLSSAKKLRSLKVSGPGALDGIEILLEPLLYRTPPVKVFTFFDTKKFRELEKKYPSIQFENRRVQ